MQRHFLLVITCLSFSLSTLASSITEYQLDRYLLSKNPIKLFKSMDIDDAQEEALVKALWLRSFSNKTDNFLVEALQGFDSSSMKMRNIIKLIAIKRQLSIEPLKQELSRFEKRDYWSDEAEVTFNSLKEEYLIGFKEPIRSNKGFFDRLFGRDNNENQRQSGARVQNNNWNQDQLKLLFDYEPDWRRATSEYKDTLKLYLLCRHNRDYICLMIMKDSDGNWVRTSSGKIWSQPKLARSRKELPSNRVDGNTPSGVFLINSVMKYADKRLVFGKYRRLKLEFVEKNFSDNRLRSFIPDELEELHWWKNGAVARDIGRNLLRIHGTGMRNYSSNSSWYPFYPTVGCIASREMDYGSVDYKDQRYLLNTMMKSMKLEVKYENEEKLKGVLYVVDINDKSGAVKLSEIEDLL